VSGAGVLRCGSSVFYEPLLTQTNYKLSGLFFVVSHFMIAIIENC